MLGRVNRIGRTLVNQFSWAFSQQNAKKDLYGTYQLIVELLGV